MSLNQKVDSSLKICSKLAISTQERDVWKVLQSYQLNSQWKLY